MNKELVIDLSWINTKLSGGGYYSVQNILNCILSNNRIVKKYSIILITREEVIDKNLTKKVKYVKLPNVYFLNFIIRWFILFFLSNSKKTQIYLCPNIYCALLKFNFKTINIFHDNQWKYYPEYYSLLKTLWIKVNIFLCAKLNDKIICTSKFIFNEFKYISKLNKLRQIYIPFKKNNKYRKVSGLKKKYVLVFSSLLPHKNINIIENIFLNTDSFKGIKNLVIAGIGGQNKRISLGNKSIIYMSKMSNPEKNWLFKNCEYYLQPSKYEGFGMTLVEAMLEKKIIICSDLKIFREIGKNSLKYVRNYNDEKNWSSIISNVNSKKKKSIKMNFEKIFSYEKISKQYLNIFENIDK